MYHFRKTRHHYKTHNQADKREGGCTFCNGLAERVIKDTKTMVVVPNRVAYDVFEGRRVIDHLMIIPKRHVETLKEFTEEEKLDMMNLAAEYETEGYNVYARGVGSITRSVRHQHTHLIKIKNNRKARIYLYMSRPYLLIHK